MSKTFAEELDELLNAHAQEFKAGHLGKVRDGFLKLVEERIIGDNEYPENNVRNVGYLRTAKRKWADNLRDRQRQCLWEGVKE